MVTESFDTLPAGPFKLNGHRKRETCRACGGTGLRLFLSLGTMPLANSFRHSLDEFCDETSYPLDVYFCETCSLVQLLDVIAPEILFRNYVYVTGTSDTIAAHNVEYAQTVTNLLSLKESDRVVEIASNDGSLLKCFQALGVSTLGVEPATNIADQARSMGLDTINQFFNSALARELRAEYGPAKAVIGNNVLAHVDHTLDFMSGCRELIDDDGLVIFEVPYLRELLDRLEYDTVYHEHLCYFSVTALLHLSTRAGLSLERVDHVPVHGGSLRVYARLQSRQQKHADSVLQLAAGEEAAGLTSLGRYVQFAAQVEDCRNALQTILEHLRSEGKLVAAYGAPAKGNTLLNYCGVDPSLVAFTVDKNPLKVGLYTPGTRIPVLPVSTLLERQPDYVLILAWNFAEEIMRQQAEYQCRGGKFIIPVPKAEVV